MINCIMCHLPFPPKSTRHLCCGAVCRDERLKQRERDRRALYQPTGLPWVPPATVKLRCGCPSGDHGVGCDFAFRRMLRRAKGAR